MKIKTIASYTLLIFCILLACVLLNLYQSFHQELSFGEIFYKNPFETCRVLTSHYLGDIYYGGLTSYLAMITAYFFYGSFLAGIGGTGIYLLLNKYIFKSNHEPDIWNEIKGRPTLIFFIIMFLTGPTYDFIIFSYYSIVIDNYNCDTLIKTIENAWYFE